MSTADNIKKIRLKKIKQIIKNNKEVYPSKSFKNSSIAEIFSHFDNWSQNKKEVCLAGRIMSIRSHGGITFIDLKDESGELQLVFKNQETEKYSQLDQYLDLSDFIEVKGYPFQTQKGEKSLMIKEWRLLSKSLKPVPAEWYGLKDAEERFRKRYLDLILNKEVKKRFDLRSKIIRALREFLEGEGFIEVETPILQVLSGGATARPFKTKLNALNMNLYLRIAPELYLKRLIVGGFEKIYEIGKCFRNEGIDRTHNPEFTMLELYWAYQNYEGLMKFIESLLANVLKSVFSGSKNPLLVIYDNKEINFTPPFPRIAFFFFF